MDRRLIRSWAGRPGRERHLLSFTSLLCALFCVLGGFSLGFRWTSQGLLLDILGLLCYVVFMGSLRMSVLFRDPGGGTGFRSGQAVVSTPTICYFSLWREAPEKGNSLQFNGAF